MPLLRLLDQDVLHAVVVVRADLITLLGTEGCDTRTRAPILPVLLELELEDDCAGARLWLRT